MDPTFFETPAIRRVVSAKKDETRAKRLSILIDACAEGVKLVSPTQREEL